MSVAADVTTSVAKFIPKSVWDLAIAGALLLGAVYLGNQSSDKSLVEVLNGMNNLQIQVTNLSVELGKVSEEKRTLENRVSELEKEAAVNLATRMQLEKDLEICNKKSIYKVE